MLLLFFLIFLAIPLSWQPPKFICHALFAQCVCVFIICGFPCFPTVFLCSALKFKQSAINNTCWALSSIPLSPLSLGHSNICTLQGASEFQYVFWLIIATAAAASASIASLSPSRRHSPTPSVCQCVSVPVQLAGSVSVGQKSDHRLVPLFLGVAPLGFANNFESNFHKLAWHTLRTSPAPAPSSACCYNCQLLQL